MRSRMVIAPEPSAPLFRVSRRTRLSMPRIWSSAESSMVMIRSSCGMKFESAFKNVVLPLPVPPLMKMLYLHSTRSFRISATSGVIDP